MRDAVQLLAVLALLASGARAEPDALVAARTIRAQSVIVPQDLARGPAMAGALTDPAEAVGMEARITIHAGRPLRAADLAPPALVERNQIVPLVWRAGGLTILAEGRALGRGAAGDTLRVMNLASKAIVTARVGSDGMLHAGGRP